MTEQLKPCPFCGRKPTDPVKSSDSDERCGYNFKVSISCKCGATISAGSKHDKQGWCDDKGEAMEAVIKAWNARAASQCERAKPLSDGALLGCLASVTHELPARLPLGWVKFARAIEAAHGITAHTGEKTE